MLPNSKILIYAINYAPEMTGCGKYTADIGEFLVKQGMKVEAVTAPPHYPGWHARDGYKAFKYCSEEDAKYGKIYRCPLILKSPMGGIWRAIAPISFAIFSAPIVLWRIFSFRPQTIYCVEPTLFAAPAALLAAKLIGAKTVLHVQDLEIDAAFAVGHMKSGIVKKISAWFEKVTTKAFDQIITISNKMKERLVGKGIAPEKIEMVRNWVDTSKIFPLNRPSIFRKELNISEEKFVALYAGNIGPKQALHLVAAAAEQLQDRDNIVFVIAGEGPEKEKLIARNLPNIVFLPLQPEEKLNELLNLADVHLLPQEKGVADLVLPSKIGGMLASGKPIIAMADEGTEIYEFLEGIASISLPGDFENLAKKVYDETLNRSSQDDKYEFNIVKALIEDLTLLHTLPILARNI